MISSVFIDRPRLAIVIAIVTTIAGALAMMRIPVAQFPDIVPPQVQVTTTFPGASAAVVEATVAQPIESQVVGVDKLIYMNGYGVRELGKNDLVTTDTLFEIASTSKAFTAARNTGLNVSLEVEGNSLRSARSRLRPRA